MEAQCFDIFIATMGMKFEKEQADRANKRAKRK